MDKFRTVAPIILMLLTALVVFYANVSLSGSGFGGAILFAMIVGFACVIYVRITASDNCKAKELHGYGPPGIDL